MAKATKQPADYTLILELSREEAETLRIIMGKIGGCPRNSRRRHTEAIRNALDGVGVKWGGDFSYRGSIQFGDGDE